MNAELLKTTVRQLEIDQLDGALARGDRPSGSAYVRTSVRVTPLLVKELDLGFALPSSADYLGDISVESIYHADTRELIKSWLSWRVGSDEPVILGDIGIKNDVVSGRNG